jgi:uncharacterized protein YbaA (DUF1428 family)
MSYVDAFVLPVPEGKLGEYRKLARLAGKVWKEHGATAYVECVADDVEPGKRTSFPRSVKLAPGEVVVLSWAIYPNKRARDRTMAKVFADPRMQFMHDPRNVPFDGKRMYWGGFKPFLEL